VRPVYTPVNTQITNDYWKNINIYRGTHWLQPRAEENRRITRITYKPVIKENNNSEEFDSGIDIRRTGSDNNTFQEASEDDRGEDYKDSNEREETVNFKGEEPFQNTREQQYRNI
jgi:hypothetical protein